ncbi:hypothetical protein ACHAQA_002131 [Verticillium albo-atrum]
MFGCDHGHDHGHGHGQQQGRRPPTPQTSPSPTPTPSPAATATAGGGGPQVKAAPTPPRLTPTPTLTPTPLGVAALGQPRVFFPSHGFVVSAGTVTVDLATRRVLLVFNKRQGIYQLPKGRKNIGEESLLACAVRETLEETGVRVTPLAVRCGTRATPGEQVEVQHQHQHQHGTHGEVQAAGGSDDGLARVQGQVQVQGQEGLTEGVDHHEAVACCHWADAATGAMKMVFYYAASADESVPPEPLVGEDEGRFENAWCEVDEAAGRLAFKTDGMVVDKAVADMRRAEYDI